MWLATIAPELPGALDVIATLVGRGVVVSLGHTDATAAEFAAGRAAGAGYVTHLFNAMRPFGHRDPGPIGAALADTDVVAGLICDGIHVDPVAVRMAWRALGPDRLNLVTDAVAALGIDGVAAVGVGRCDRRRHRRAQRGGRARRQRAAPRRGTAQPGGLHRVRGAGRAGDGDVDPGHACSGVTDRGRLEPGARADVTVLDDDLRVVETVVGGEVAWRS